MCRVLIIEQGNLSVMGPHFYIKSLQPLNEQLGYAFLFDLYGYARILLPLKQHGCCDFQTTNDFTLLEPSALAHSNM
jgi:hypothetical protein